MGLLSKSIDRTLWGSSLNLILFHRESKPYRQNGLKWMAPLSFHFFKRYVEPNSKNSCARHEQRDSKMKQIYFPSLISMLFCITLCITGCQTTKPVPAAKVEEMVEISMPCGDYGKDNEDYYAGMGVGENTNMQAARIAALEGAKDMIKRKIGGHVKGLSSAYSRVLTGSAAQNDVQSIIEGEILTTLDKMLNDAEQTCEKMFKTSSGTYQAHIAVKISKEELVDKSSTALSKNEKLEMEFNREQFRKWMKEHMKEEKEFNEGK